MATLFLEIVNMSIIAACPLAFGEGSVKGRIKNVLHYKKPTFWVIVLTVVVSIFLVVCFMTNPTGDELEIPYIEETTLWEAENIQEITIYADGYYGRTMEEPLGILDRELISEIVAMIRDEGAYREIPEGEALESIPEVYVDFGNGIVCGFSVIDGGYFQTLILSDDYQGFLQETNGSSSERYYLPREFCIRIISLLEENKPQSYSPEEVTEEAGESSYVPGKIVLP